jgi:hypothetical protein
MFPCAYAELNGQVFLSSCQDFGENSYPNQANKLKQSAFSTIPQNIDSPDPAYVRIPIGDIPGVVYVPYQFFIDCF